VISELAIAAPPTPPVATLPSRGSFEIRRARARRVLTVVVLIALGATSGIHVLGYTLTGLIPVCLLLAPAVLLARPTLGQWLPLALAVIGFVAFFVSFQINHLSVIDQRGVIDERVLQWPAFAIYYVGFLVLAGRDLERACSILCGIAIGTLVYYLQPGKLPPDGAMDKWMINLATTFSDIWKYAFGQWVVIIVVFLLIVLKVTVPLQAVFLVLLGGFSLVQQYRSLAANCVIAAVILLVSWLFAGKTARWLQLTIVAVFGTVIYTLVPKIVMSGLFGDAVRRQMEPQLDSGVPLILAGRTESPLSISAILSRPWFGWGSANNISTEVFEHAKTLAISLGFDPAFNFESLWYLKNGDVQLHSVLLGAWAEGGPFAGLLPLGLLVAALAIVWNAWRYGRWAALAVVVAVQAAWDLVFSPFAVNFLPGYAILAVLFAARHLPREVGAKVGGIARD
jgi:hypothetical protein